MNTIATVFAHLMDFLDDVSPFYRTKYSSKYHDHTSFFKWIVSEHEVKRKVQVFQASYLELVGKRIDSTDNVLKGFFKAPQEFVYLALIK